MFRWRRGDRGGHADAGRGREEGGQHRWGGGDHLHHQHSGQLYYYFCQNFGQVESLN